MQFIREQYRRAWGWIGGHAQNIKDVHIWRLGLKKSKEKSEKAPPKSGNKFVLIIGEDGAIVLYLSGRKVVRRAFALSSAPKDMAAINDLFALNKRAPISILLDIQDQTYTVQNLPPVAKMSADKIAKRKLERDFAADDLKAFICIGRSPDKKKEWQYMFISVPPNPLSEWINIASNLPNKFGGVFLIPLESEKALLDLDKKIHWTPEPKAKKAKKAEAKPVAEAKDIKKGKKSQDKNNNKYTPPDWFVFIGHNRVGGLRQIVLKNGKMAFTRVTQAALDDPPEALAGSIEQEYSTTREYIKRLGYSDASKLNVVIVAAEAVLGFVDRNKILASNVDSFTPYQACELLGMKDTAEKQDKYSDVFLAVSVAALPRKKVSLQTPYIAKLFLFQRAILGGRVAAGILVPLLLLAAAYEIYGAISAKLEVVEIEDKQKQANSRILTLQSSNSALPTNLEKVINVTDIHNKLASLIHDPYYLMEVLATEVDETMNVSAFKWQNKNAVAIFSKNDPAAPPVTIDGAMECDIKLDFTKYGDEKTLKKMASSKTASLKEQLGDHNIAIAKLPGELAGKDVMEVDYSRQSAAKNMDEITTIDMQITLPKAPDNSQLPGVVQ